MALATVWPDSSTASTFVPEVPTSIPRNTLMEE